MAVIQQWTVSNFNDKFSTISINVLRTNEMNENMFFLYNEKKNTYTDNNSVVAYLLLARTIK